MLFVLPFLVMAVAFISHSFPPTTLELVKIRGVINIAYINQLELLWLAVTGSVVVIGLAYLIFFINEKYKLLSQTSTLPSLIYVLLTSGIMVSLGFDYLLIAVLIVALAIERLQAAIRDIKANGVVFDFGCLIILAVAIYPKFVFLVLWGMCVLLFSGRSTLKDIMALWLGLLTPVLFIVFYYFWTDQLAQLPVVFLDNLRKGEYIHHLPTIEWVRLGILLFLLLIAFYQLSVRYALLMVNQRRGVLSLVSLLLFLSLTFFVIPGNYYDFMYMLALPMSLIYAYFFISNRNVVFGNLMFILLLCACFLTYLV